MLLIFVESNISGKSKGNRVSFPQIVEVATEEEIEQSATGSNSPVEETATSGNAGPLLDKAECEERREVWSTWSLGQGVLGAVKIQAMQLNRFILGNIVELQKTKNLNHSHDNIFIFTQSSHDAR